MVMGASRRIVALSPGVDHAALERGRAHRPRLRQVDAETGVVSFNLHQEPASIVDAKRPLLGGAWRRTVESESCAQFIFGDLNCFQIDDHMVDLRRIELVGGSRALPRRQISDRGPILLSQIDRMPNFRPRTSAA